MGHRQIRSTCPITREGRLLLHQAFDKLQLSARSYDRIIKVSRTIADLAGTDVLDEEHVAEALSFRNTLQRM
jgi:magnesium chelatase family protein